ncbi:hypothetical protein [Streptomyces sp. NPDC001480]|uniref:hypothetical protein n=1 Tax=Streptomyces sp. NPDC001480 TaxID=3364577 RepID=UPI0036BD3F50
MQPPTAPLGLMLKGEDRTAVGQGAQQISLRDAREARLLVEAAISCLRDEFGPA